MDDRSETVVTRAYRFRCAPSPSPASVTEFRLGYAALFGRFPVKPGAAVAERTIGGVRTLVVRAGRADPEAAAGQATVVYCHGGGYVCGNPEAVRHVAGHLARALPAEVFLPGYRLAPEHPFPAAVHDVVAVYRALLDEGRSPGTITMAGESAGAGLALAALVADRRADLPLDGNAVCFSPWVDLTLTAGSIRRNGGSDTVVGLETLTAFAAAYLGGQSPRQPTASPVFADLAGFPPLLVQVGSGERLVDDAVRLADRARAAGVAVTLEVLPGAPHAVQLFTPEIPEARAALDRAADFIAAVLKEPVP